MDRFYRRIIISFLFIIASLSILIGRLVDAQYAEANAEKQLQELENQMIMIESQLESRPVDEAADLIDLINPIAQSILPGVTLFDQEGQLVYDTMEADSFPATPQELSMLEEDRLIESRKTIDGGESMFFYVTTAISNADNERIALLRLADTENKPAISTGFIQTYFFVFMLLSLAVLFLFFRYWTKRLVKPINDIKEVTANITNQDYTRRYRGNDFREIDELGYSINKLSSKLEFQVQELENRNEQLNKLIENLNIGIMLLDESRLIKMVNPAMSEILEINMSGNIGRPYIHFISNPWIIELIEMTYETGKAQSEEFNLVNSEEDILDATIIPVNLVSETEHGLIVLFYDITEIRRLEKVRTDFVANASHELRTPVTALKGFTETLLDGALEDRNTLIHFLEIMHEESERLDSIVGDVLQLSRLEQRVDRMNLEPVNVQEVVTAVYHILDQKAENKHIDLRLNVIDDLTICYDHDTLKQILLNLISNAILYNREYGYVEVSITQMNHEAQICVKDNGIGIKDHEQKRIFERFYRVDKARSRNSGGTGLGLSIVRHMIENTGGSITLESKLNRGSTFCVYLPLEEKN